MKKKYLNWFTLILLISPLISSCVRTDGQDAQTEDNTQAKVQAEAVAGGDGEPSSEAAEKGKSIVSEPEGADFLLYSDFRPVPVIAEDFEIGPLQGRFGNDAKTADILNTAESFLRSLERGEVQSDLVSSAKKSFVERMTVDGLAFSLPDGYRIGEINTIADPVWAKIRMFGSEGSGTGMMYFVQEGGWKVYDFHFDFMELERNTDPGPEGWDPDDRKKQR